jgi:hypothetical protein
MQRRNSSAQSRSPTKSATPAGNKSRSPSARIKSGRENSPKAIIKSGVSSKAPSSKKSVTLRIRSKSSDERPKTRKLSKLSKSSMDKINFVENENYESIKTKILKQLMRAEQSPEKKSPAELKKMNEKLLKSPTKSSILKESRPKSRQQNFEYEDLSNQGLASINVNSFQSKFLRFTIFLS